MSFTRSRALSPRAVMAPMAVLLTAALFLFAGLALAQQGPDPERFIVKFQDGKGPQGKAALLYPQDAPTENRGAWRFNRALSGGRWQRLGSGGWELFNAPPRSAGEAPVNCIFWSDAVAADIGTWDDSQHVACCLSLLVDDSHDGLAAACADGGGCTACFQEPAAADKFKIIFTRPA